MEQNMDFADIAARNVAFENREEDTLLTRADLSDLTRVLQLAAESSVDGEERNYAAQRLVTMGDAKAARTILHFADGEMEETVLRVFDLWRDGTNAGILECNKDYTLTPEDLKYFERLITFVGEAGYEMPLSEITNENLRLLAQTLMTEEELDMEALVGYVLERESFDLEGFREYLSNYAAVREGSL